MKCRAVGWDVTLTILKGLNLIVYHKFANFKPKNGIHTTLYTPDLARTNDKTHYQELTMGGLSGISIKR